MNDKQILTCPYCHEKSTSTFWRVNKNGKKFAIAWCGNCEFGWQHPYPSEEDIKQLYSRQKLYHDNIVDETQGGFPQRIRILNELKPEKGTILDIGSGMGHFLRHAQLAGWSADGVEPRPSASEYCYRHFGITVFNGIFEDWFPPKKYDAVTLWDVLEHVRNPFRILDKCNQLLAPGGLLVLSIPNASGLPARCFKENWRYVMPSHINYFTMTFIKNSLKEKGFDILKMDHRLKAQSIFEGIVSFLPNQVDAEMVYKTYGRTEIGDDPIERASRRAARIFKIFIYKFNMLSYKSSIGDIVDIYCRKPNPMHPIQ